MPYEIIYFLGPLIITIPLYIGGRKVFFKGVPQHEMHLSISGRIFTIIIGIIQIVLGTILYLNFE